MMREGSRSSPPVGGRLLTVAGIIAGLYFARIVLIPLTLAVLLAFLLAPAVHWLKGRGVWRTPAVLIVVLCSFAIVGAIGTVVALQLSDLAHRLPDYEHNFHQKLDSIRESGGSLVTRVSGWVHDTTEELTPKPAHPEPPKPGQPAEPAPIPVEIAHSNFSPVSVVQKLLGSVISVFATAVIVIVFVIFMLIQETSLRNRLVRLAGSGHGNLTTRVLQDAGWRVSRYLIAQTLVNAAYGLVLGTALYFIGVPNPILWGTLACLFRFIPYVGIWIAAVMPAAVAFAIEPGWIKMPIIFALYIGIDVCLYNFVEPFLYGNKTGVSPLAILIAAVFWTWLWGPAGLLLSMPLTVLVLAVGRHVPSFEFLNTLLGDDREEERRNDPATIEHRHHWRPRREPHRAG